MLHEEFMSLKEMGKKGNFLLPFVVSRTVMPDFYTTFPMHWHQEMEIIYIEQGEFEQTIDFELYHVKKGDIIIIPPCTLHSFRQFENERTVFKTVMFDFSMLTGNTTDACSIKYFNQFLEGNYTSPKIISKSDGHYAELRDCILEIISTHSKNGNFYEIQIKSELYKLFFILFKYFFECQNGTPPIKDSTTRNIKIILDYIAENYDKTITIDELAERVDLSKHYFMRFFKKYMGTTCIEYINDYRLNIAANLLITTRKQITEIAMSIGITNLSYFNRIFRKKYNMTPKEYRSCVDKSNT